MPKSKRATGQLKVILSTNLELLKQLQVSIEENGGEGVGKEIASRSAYLRCDTLSINNNTNSQNTIADLQKNNKAFRKFLKECSQNPASLSFPIESFLILPVQRLPRFKMLIEQLLKNTEENHQKFEQIESPLMTEKVNVAHPLVNIMNDSDSLSPISLHRHVFLLHRRRSHITQMWKVSTNRDGQVDSDRAIRCRLRPDSDTDALLALSGDLLVLCHFDTLSFAATVALLRNGSLGRVGVNDDSTNTDTTPTTPIGDQNRMCGIAFCRGSGTIAFGLMKSNSPLPQVGELLGNKVKNSISLNRSGSLWVKTPSSHSLQDCHTVLREGDSVRMEVDLSSTPRTVQFFVNGEAGECYMSGIPSSVRIGSSIRGGGGSFRIDSISRLSQPSPILEGMLEIKWSA
ncbi:putative RhoGEF domain containing protein [Blattamonas nauphoetae]|uniref:RhoGEF domain containing protein n=1 Tax=Blattamonas nauphoetae TaxID=2049346 RepID=A0ABQ9X573_9EUKA|nr:putative RhoGEF domain containing protein [Blattamonas nauphoetae]